MVSLYKPLPLHIHSRIDLMSWAVLPGIIRHDELERGKVSGWRIKRAIAKPVNTLYITIFSPESCSFREADEDIVRKEEIV